ncbi:MAG: DUF4274 domain-containing protein [Clostridium sp.]|uniref:DUF4274 domain-containing protein n=1 Tax=Clostridium sp. TaxID=1506 RepID=UPI002913506B|nr:DUF4274 domain-containing protein [Clostridium sp.]MDU7337320.1 DUF4274 domain-containing protein [Clostridium sp.]
MFNKNDKSIFDIINNYNWDDGFDYPASLLLDNPCDLALALCIFYLADGYRFLQAVPEQKDRNSQWVAFIDSLYRNIIDGSYVKTKRPYRIPLTKVQLYHLQKLEVPEVFLKDLP